MLTLVLGPDCIRRGVVVDPGQVSELVELELCRDPELVLEFARGSLANSCEPKRQDVVSVWRPSPSRPPHRPLFLNDSPIWPSSSCSPPLVRGWEQQVFVHILGKVIFSSARFWRRRSPVSGWNRNTEKARWSGERDSDEPGGGIRWPVSGPRCRVGVGRGASDEWWRGGAGRGRRRRRSRRGVECEPGCYRDVWTV